MILWYEEGYPDSPKLDVDADNVLDWDSKLFLNESSVVDYMTHSWFCGFIISL